MLKKIPQNNPILYVFIGGIPEAFIQKLKAIQEEQIDGVGYLECSDNISEEIRIIQERFIAKPYLSIGEIKINYVMDAGDPNCSGFPKIKETIESGFRLLYPGGVISDAFLLLDDAHVRPDKKNVHRQTFDMVEAGGLNMVYILSNVSSKNTYEPENDDSIVRSIAYLALLKDCSVPVPNMNRYNERYFKADCLNRGGKYTTLGHIRIEKPCQVEPFLLAKLLKYQDKPVPPECPVPFDCAEIFNLSFERGFDFNRNLFENLLGLPLSGEVSACSNQQALRIWFGGRLERFYGMNYLEMMTEVVRSETENALARVKAFLEDVIHSAEYGFYFVNAITAPDGALRSRIEIYRERYQKDCAALESEYNSWLSQTAAHKGKPALFGRINPYPYRLAEQYIKYKVKIFENQAVYNLIEQTLTFVEMYYAELHQLKCAVDDRGASPVFDSGFFSANEVRSYYTALLDTYIRETPDSFLKLYKNFYDYVRSENLNEYEQRLQELIQDEILPLDDGLEKMSSNISSQTALNWIHENKKLNIFLSSGIAKLYCETNIFFHENKLFSEAKPDTEDKVNFFYQESGQSIDVLYHAGGFGKEDLYYSELYLS